MEPTSSACTVGALTCSQLALATTGVIIGIAIIYTMNKTIPQTFFEGVRKTGKQFWDGSSKLVKSHSASKKEKKIKEAIDKNFSLLLITTSEKLRENIKITNTEYDQTIRSETVKKLINTSRYFLIEDIDNNILSNAKTSDSLPDLEKDSLFILKITGQGKHNIATCKTKLGLRDSITSESCKIEKVLHLLDARIAEKFIPTI